MCKHIPELGSAPVGELSGNGVRINSMARKDHIPRYYGFNKLTSIGGMEEAGVVSFTYRG
jgi:hypothetical protein